MSWLDLPDDEATPQLARLTNHWRKEGIPVPPIYRPLKLDATSFRAVLQLNNAVTFGASTLGRRKEELITVAVSAWNDCFY